MNGNKKQAQLTDGTLLEYFETANPPNGQQKETYFGPGRRYVVQLYKDANQNDGPRLARLQEIIHGTRNITRAEADGGAVGLSQQAAAHFRQLFCWPTGIVKTPRRGIVAPCFPAKYFFTGGKLKTLRGKEKRLGWFVSAYHRQNSLLPEDLGTLREYLLICLRLARAVRKLHATGLTHSDLSDNNILIEPRTGECMLLDVDALVAPGSQRFKAEVRGTGYYMAPEIFATLDLPAEQCSKPCVEADRHSLAVLIYQLLFWRHPLQNRRNLSGDDEEDDHLRFGRLAAFVETEAGGFTGAPSQAAGPELYSLFRQAFVDALHEPAKRPTAGNWEVALINAIDRLVRCENPACSHKWFLSYKPVGTRLVCPFCGAGRRQATSALQFFRLNDALDGWREETGRQLFIDETSGTGLYAWHVLDNVYRNENADGQLQAAIGFSQGSWWLWNHKLPGLTVNGAQVPLSTSDRPQPQELHHGDIVWFAAGNHGRYARVDIG